MLFFLLLFFQLGQALLRRLRLLQKLLVHRLDFRQPPLEHLRFGRKPPVQNLQLLIAKIRILLVHQVANPLLDLALLFHSPILKLRILNLPSRVDVQTVFIQRRRGQSHHTPVDIHATKSQPARSRCVFVVNIRGLRLLLAKLLD